MMAGSKVYFKITLNALLKGYARIDLKNDRMVTGMTLDSRNVKPGDLFIACIGLKVNGAEFIGAAIEKGAVAVLWEPQPGSQPIPVTYRNSEDGQKIPVIAIADLSKQAGLIAHRFYSLPSAAMYVTGVTGTNGKTSVSQFLAQCLNEDVPCGVIGTIGHGLYGALGTTTHTTPDALTVHKWLAEMRELGASSIAMEVSSHALDQGRVNGVEFDCAVFTNLSRDHLDYHGDMQSYAASKRSLFEQPGLHDAVINSDDEYGRELLNKLPATVSAWRYGFDEDAQPEVLGKNLRLSSRGFELDVVTPLGNAKINCGLLGRFNASNLLAVLAVLLVRGISLTDAVNRLNKVSAVPGRMETFGGDGKPLVVVDYAHTPDALQQLLQAVREHIQARVFCVFGCGGDRDKGKRPLMGEIAESMADSVILTTDNPRSEDPISIIQEIQHGMKKPDAGYVIAERGEAIARAIDCAKQDDVVVVAGKGHETWQQIGNKKIPFSDVEEVQKQLQGWQP